MSDLFDDSEDVAIVPAPAEEKPQKKKPGRPRKAKTEGDEKKISLSMKALQNSQDSHANEDVADVDIDAVAAETEE